jgi:lysophospholipid acyltransferase (LPLAT)-like uncharacterized protein
MRGPLKRFGDQVALFLAFWIGPLLIRTLGATLRVDFTDRGKLAGIRRSGQSVIYAFWHGRMLILAYTHRQRRIHILISQHRDGELIARIIERLGFVTVRGSTTRGGTKAIFEMCEKASSGYDVGVTPDGPKGPGFCVHPGIIYMAQRSGLPIVPITNSAQHRWTLPSWDGFIIPRPFSRAVVMLGEPINVPPDSDARQLELIRTELENRLRQLTQKADGYFSEAG